MFNVDIITWEEKCPYGHAFANTWIATYYVTKKNHNCNYNHFQLLWLKEIKSKKGLSPM